MNFRIIKPDLGIAWIILTITLLIHVIDEAMNDFLSFYNPIVSRLKEHIPFLPIPTFTFNVWLAGLIIAIILLFALSVYSFRGSAWIVNLSFIYGGIMFLNGTLHIAGSIYYKIPMPGVYSSTILLVSSVYLIWSAYRHKFGAGSI